MDEITELRAALVNYVRNKFRSRSDIAGIAEDIVDEAFLSIMERGGDINFGYLSVTCLHIAYKAYKKQSQTVSLCESAVGEDDFVSDIESGIDAAFVIRSLDTLRELEKIVITERYYGACSFREIAQKHGINLNTILSHHRRALRKLKPVFTDYFNYDDRPDYYK